MRYKRRAIEVKFLEALLAIAILKEKKRFFDKFVDCRWILVVAVDRISLPAREELDVVQQR